MVPELDEDTMLLCITISKHKIHVYSWLSRRTNYIISWLSIVGPVVGLNLPLSYAKAISEQSASAD